MRVIFLALVLGGCSSLEGDSRPIHEMVFASAALKAAEKSRAERFAPDLYRKAEANYWKAKSYFATRQFTLARQSAFLAKRYAENAEMMASLKQVEEGHDEF